jgi:Acyl-CoA reductase (LuxC)
VVVKSGRDDPLSATVFQRALAAVDPDLAATVVTAYWPGGAPDLEEILFARADVAVLTGGEPAIAALARRVGRRLVTHGPRVSVAAVGREGLEDVEQVAHAVALDVALYEQRGCLSPRAVYVESGGRLAPRDFAERLAAALDALAERLPPVSADVEERAAARVLREGADWTSGTTVLSGPGGIVVYDEDPSFRPTMPARSLRVHPIASLAALPELLPAARIECLGLAAGDPRGLVPALREHGVSRLCPVGRMQRPPLAWPRGQHAPLGALLGHPGPLRCTVET